MPETEPAWEASAATAEALQANVSAAALAALTEVRNSFPDHQVWAWPDGTGGVQVVIENVELGATWAQETTWLGFTINYLYPEADTYPHYVRADLARADGAELVPPYHHLGQSFSGRPAVMVSRSSPQRVSGSNTAMRKALSVVTFIQEAQ